MCVSHRVGWDGECMWVGIGTAPHALQSIVYSPACILATEICMYQAMHHTLIINTAMMSAS